MKNEKGFTLIELVVSIAVLSVLIVPFFGIFTNAAKLDMRSNKDLTANYLAQQLASEAKEHPMTHAGWTESTDGTETVFTKDSLVDDDGNYGEYSAVLTYGDFAHSVSSNGYENLPNVNGTFNSIFDFKWDNNTKTLVYNCGESGGDTTVEDNANSPQIIIENDKDSLPYGFILTFQADKNNNNSEDALATYYFTEYTDTIRLKISLNSTSNPPNNASLRIVNGTNTDQEKHPEKGNHLLIEVYTENLGFDGYEDDSYDASIKTTGDISPINLDEIEAVASENSLKRLTIEVKGYDPISGTNKVLKKLVTSVGTDS